MQELGRFFKRLLNPESPSDSSLSQPSTKQPIPDLTTPSLSAVDIINQRLGVEQQKREAAKQAEKARRLAEQQRQNAIEEQVRQIKQKEEKERRIRIQEKQRVLQSSGVVAELEKIRNELRPDANIQEEEESHSVKR